MTELYIYTDGASRGNPGEAGVGVIIYNNDGEELQEISEYIGHATNNVAEYTAMLRGLDVAIQFGADKVNIFADSELMIKQMNGQYKVKNEGLIPLFNQAQKKLKEFKAYTFQHVPREKNKKADQLANQGIDNKNKQESIQVKSQPVTASPQIYRQILSLGQESMLVKFIMDKGAKVPLQVHDNEIVCYLIKGAICFKINGQEKILQANDNMVIPRNEEYSIIALEDSEILDFFKIN